MKKQLEPRDLNGDVAKKILYMCRVVEIEITDREYDIISDMVYYGSRVIADEIYPFSRPVYDEDAGVYTDYGENKPDRTWAQVNLIQLLSRAIITAKWVNDADERGYDPERKMLVYILDMSIPAINQALFKLCSDEKLQKRVWMNKITGDYESDGHYGSQTKQEYIETELKRLWVDRKTGRELAEKLGY